MSDIIIEKGEKVEYENKLFNFDLIIQEKDRKTAGDGKKIKVKKQQEIKVLWKKYGSGLVVGQPVRDSEIIQFEKDGKKYDIEVKELILNKGLFRDTVTHFAFAPDLRLISYGVPYSDYPPYHVYNLNRMELKNGVGLVKPLKVGRLVGAGALLFASLGFLLFCLAKFLKKRKLTTVVKSVETRKSNKSP